MEAGLAVVRCGFFHITFHNAGLDLWHEIEMTENRRAQFVSAGNQRCHGVA